MIPTAASRSYPERRCSDGALFKIRSVGTGLGNAISGAGVYVCSQPSTQGHFDDATGAVIPPTPQVQLYKDPAGTMPLAQPVQTDGYGHAWFYTLAGVYQITYYSPQIQLVVLPDQVVVAAGGPITTAALTGTIDGSNHLFMLPTTPNNFQMVFLNGVLQLPGGINYSIAFNRVTMTVAPSVGDQLYAVFQ
jgi:hypothetical protein